MLPNFLGVQELDAQQRSKVYDELSSASHPDFDFFFMVGLSAIIATFGLLLNNVAVIIGAMLVAPLLSPVLSLSLGAIYGDFYLFARALEAEVKGILLAIIVATMLTLLAPGAESTYEILIRTSPTPFDLIVALAAGAAGAYAFSKERLSATLPGIAIATAVLPPLATIGIGLGLHRFDIAGGAILLFLANLIAIVVASAIIFWLLGFGPRFSKIQEAETMNRLRISFILLILISVPLVYLMVNALNEEALRTTVEETLNSQILGMDDTTITSIHYEEIDGVLHVEATILTPEPLTSSDSVRFQNALENVLKRPVAFELDVVRLTVYNVEAEPS
ncbi:TIGR00341 family protein [Candidatus Micrarchaeota archaeon]|nr:MAG: TIGR00341 family protein [Candidatus Micrarchaeota archaeon]